VPGFAPSSNNSNLVPAAFVAAIFPKYCDELSRISATSKETTIRDLFKMSEKKTIVRRKKVKKEEDEQNQTL
jgi:hypothetical protein